jgi:hypothetical protein
MDYVGIDVHKKESQICILADGGELIECRVRTERGRFAEVFARRPPARILVEASTESEWVAGAWRGWGTRWWWPTPTLPRCTRPGGGR